MALRHHVTYSGASELPFAFIHTGHIAESLNFELYGMPGAGGLWVVCGNCNLWMGRRRKWRFGDEIGGLKSTKRRVIQNPILGTQLDYIFQPPLLLDVAILLTVSQWNVCGNNVCHSQ